MDVVSLVQGSKEHGAGGVRRRNMYISEFVCGAITGALVEFVALVILAIWCDKEDKKNIGGKE